MLKSPVKFDLLFKSVFICFSYLFISFYMERSLLSEAGDGFYYQVMSVHNNDDLGTLGFLHTIRYLLVTPFLYFNIKFLEPFIFLMYVSIFVFSKTKTTKQIGLLCLFFSIFFSYRSVFVMLSIALLFDHILYNRKSFIILFYSAVLSLFSTGSFLAYIIILFFYRKDILNKKYSSLIPISIIGMLVAVSGSLAHKIFFFLDENKYSSASTVSFYDFLDFDIANVSSVVLNVATRGVLYESYTLGGGRFYLIAFYLLLVALLVIIRRDKASYVLMLLYFLGLIFEGLMLYSIFIAVIVLILDRFKLGLKLS